MPISHHSHHLSRNNPAGEQPNRDSPEHSDPERGNNPPRRRISLACSRCRKRKIKCSGDPGNGQGCQNCKQAGTDINQCQFLRVNSMEAICNPSVHWDYAANGTSQLGSNLGQLHSGSSISSSFPQESYYPSTNQYARVPYSNGATNLHYPNISTRQSLGSSFISNVPDEAFDQYSIQSPQYLLPSQDPQLPTNNFTMQEMTRNWTPMGASSRTHQPSLGFEQETTSRYGNSGFPYYSSLSSGVATTADGLSLVPAMSGFGMSIPVPNVPSGRTLPEPRKRSSQMSSTTVLQNHSGNMTAGGTGSRVSYKSSTPWGSEPIVTSGIQRSTNNASVSINVTGPASTKSSGLSQCTQETPFGYTVPTSHSPPPVTSTQASMYGSHNLASSAQMSNQLGSVDSMLQPSISSESLLSSHGSSSNLYGYSLGNGAKSSSYADSGESDGTLVSGQPYNRLRQMQPQLISSLGSIRRESMENHSPLVHRGSIASVSNGKRF